MTNENEDTPLFSYDGTLGYNYGSDTSHARMVEEQKTAKTKQEAILNLFRVAGISGLTSSDAEEKTGWKHQTVSSHIRNMELAGVLCKTKVIRNKQHVYIHSAHAVNPNAPEVLAPTPPRNWRKKFDALVSELEEYLVDAEDKNPHQIANDMRNIVKRNKR